LAQVQADFFAREALVTPADRQRRRADFAWAAVVERQQALQEIAPGCGAAWALVHAKGLPAVPLHPTTLDPVGDAIADRMAVLDYWQANPTHAVGVRLGAQQAGRFALVGLRVAAWGDWHSWLRAHAVETRVRPWAEDPTRGSEERVGKPLGGPSAVCWVGPPAPAMRFWDSGPGSDPFEDVAAWRKVNTPVDRGGWLYWTVGPQQGRLPTLRHRTLGAGVVVLADSDVLPLWAATPQGWRLQQDALVPEPDPHRDAPGWLLERFGAKWTAAG
jgi:hypothetical protein